MTRGPVHSLPPDCRRWGAFGRLTACVAVIILVLSGSGAADQPAHQPAGADGNGASQQPSREYLIKAAILYNFAKFTRWPAESFESEDAVARVLPVKSSTAWA